MSDLSQIEKLNSKVQDLGIEMQDKDFLIWDLKAEVDALHNALRASHSRISRLERPSVRI